MPNLALLLDALGNWPNLGFAAVIATACVFVFGPQHPS
jgi:hypothetical protein